MAVKKKIYVAVLNQGWVRVEVATLMHRMACDSRFDVKITHPMHKPVDANHNIAVKEFLKTDCDYMFIMGDDSACYKNPLDLVLLDKDIIVCPTPQWNDTCKEYPMYHIAMDWDEKEKGWKEHTEKEGLQEVDAVGSANILIARRVLEKIEAPFMRKWGKDGIPEEGLDFRFCKRAKEAGFRVWAHYDYLACHYNELNMMDVIKFKYG